MTAKQPSTKLKLAVQEPVKAQITVTGVRQEALENFAGSIAQVTDIANGVCYVSVKERCLACGTVPAPALDAGQLLKIVPRPAEITQANALLAKISLPAQSEQLNLAEGKVLIEATIWRLYDRAIAYGVPADVVAAWHDEATKPLQAA